MIQGGHLLKGVTEVIVPIIDAIALIVIAAGTIEAFVNGLRLLIQRSDDDQAMRASWIRYSRWLVAGLTFQLAADIIQTSIAPGWDEIGRLGAVAGIRTFLNYFLEHDQRDRGAIRLPE